MPVSSLTTARSRRPAGLLGTLLPATLLLACRPGAKAGERSAGPDSSATGVAAAHRAAAYVEPPSLPVEFTAGASVPASGIAGTNPAAPGAAPVVQVAGNSVRVTGQMRVPNSCVRLRPYRWDPVMATSPATATAAPTVASPPGTPAASPAGTPAGTPAGPATAPGAAPATPTIILSVIAVPAAAGTACAAELRLVPYTATLPKIGRGRYSVQVVHRYDAPLTLPSITYGLPPVTVP